MTEFNGLVDSDEESKKLPTYFLREGCEKHRVLNMAHHGPVVIGESCADAMEDLY